MNQLLKSNNCFYLDDFNIIRFVSDKTFKINSISLYYEYEEYPLVLDNVIDASLNKIYFFKTTTKIDPRLDYKILLNGSLYRIFVGDITLKESFDEEYYFNDWLGYKFNKNSVTFRLWAPVSKEVLIVINKKEHQMHYIHHGVYEINIPNSKNELDGGAYHYLIRNDEKYVEVLDPYALSVDGMLKECFIINLDKTYKYKTTFVDNTLSNKENSIIYEASVRDFTSSLPINNKGLFLGIVESSTLDDHGINYLNKIGITHIQLGPVFCFGGVNNLIKSSYDPKFLYNWGYNPILYNALSGWFVSNPNNPYCSINEFKMMIECFHKNNIGVIMDVVYNHVYKMEEYALHVIVPKYPYRYFSSDTISNGSWCGNDIATERRMNRKFIIDSLLYYQNEFKIDGFRFDLMGLIDIETLNDASTLLLKNNPNTLLYGEGWQMNTAYDSSKLAHMFNSDKLSDYSFFNDYFRNTIKGKASEYKASIFQKADHNKELFESLFSGKHLFSNSTKSINYVECHDNLTMYDEQIKLGINKQDAIENAKMALVFVLFSKGISFIHSGEEILRTKYGIDNSYNKSDVVNKFPWHHLIIYEDVLDYFIKLVNIKKRINFGEYKYVKTLSKDKVMKVIFENSKNEKLNLYINLKNTLVTLDLSKEELIFGTNSLKRSVSITLSK